MAAQQEDTAMKNAYDDEEVAPAFQKRTVGKERPILPPNIQALADQERRDFQERARAAAAGAAAADAAAENGATNAGNSMSGNGQDNGRSKEDGGSGSRQ